MPINYGILQPINQMAPSSTQVIQRPNTAAQQEGLLIQGANSLNSAIQEGRRSDIAQANSQSEIAARNQQMDIAKQMLPGQLQGQNLQNQGMGLLNQQKQMEMAGIQLQMQQRQERVNAYQAAKAHGGVDAGVEAVKNKYLDQGDIDSGMKIAKTQEELRQQIANDNKSGILSIGSAIHGVMTSVVPPSVNQQTGQVNPGRDSLQVYADRYPIISKQYPDAPKPSSFRNAAQFEDTFVHPVLDNALPFQKEVAAKQDAMIKSNTYKAGLVIDDAKAKLKSTIQENGANSQEARDAAAQLQRAQDDAIRASQGGNPVTGTVRAMKSILPESLGGTPSIESTIKQNTPGYQPPSKQSSVDLSQGQNQMSKSSATLPPGVTPQMIQQELTRRQSLQGK